MSFERKAKKGAAFEAGQAVAYIEIDIYIYMGAGRYMSCAKANKTNQLRNDNCHYIHRHRVVSAIAL